MSLDQPDQWCPICGRPCAVADDGGMVRHPMRYAAMVEHLASVVTAMEAGWWEPIWAQPHRPRRGFEQ